MENPKNKILKLLNKKKWTDEEKQWMLDYLENTDTEALRDLMQQEWEDGNYRGKRMSRKTSNKILQRIHDRIGIEKTENKGSIRRIWVFTIAAAVIGLFILTCVELKNAAKIETVQGKVNNGPHKNEIFPDSNKTILTLGDGSRIVLDDAQNGALARQGGANVSKLNGRLTYNSINQDSGIILYNSISTARGKQYQIELPDGSEVWMNAASSLSFPTVFAGKERRVEVTGEVYFEIARNTEMPFVVKVNGAEIRVLGTRFNIMAYDDEPVLKTTLLEGKVKFINGNFSGLLQPGQQSRLTKNGQVKVVSGIDLTGVMAWKEGFFDFEGADIEFITRQLSRWYGVEIVHDSKIDDLFYAKIPRNTGLTDVLKALELTGKVRFAIEGKKITVIRAR